MKFSVAPELTGIVSPCVLQLAGATVVEHDPRLDPLLAETEAAIRADPPDEVTAVRVMYRQVGIDPTRTRPSSEALLRRIRKGGSLPRINSMVDVCNWCSLVSQLPYGLYDAGRIVGDVTLRLGLAGESYAGIRKDEVHVAGRITLADELGPFGNPTSDSGRTMVTTETTQALVVIFAPSGLDSEIVAGAMTLTASRMRRFTGADVISQSC